MENVRDDIDPLVALARETVEEYTLHGTTPKMRDNMPSQLLQERAGAFVSLHEGDNLRGCIGTIEPVQQNLAQEIISNAVSACSRDPRFTPVRPEELDYISYSVDVLFPAEPISSLEDLDPKRYGVIVSSGMRRGLLLPDLEGVDTAEQQIAISMQKAGITPDIPNIHIERFEVIRHSAGGEARKRA